MGGDEVGTCNHWVFCMQCMQCMASYIQIIHHHSMHHDTHDQHRWKSTSNCCEREEGHVDRLVMAVVVGSEEGRTSAGERLSLQAAWLRRACLLLTFVSCVCKFVVDASRDTLSLVSVRHTLGSRSHGRGSSHLHMNNDSGVGCVCVRDQ